MRKPDELRLWAVLRERAKHNERLDPETAFGAAGVHPKRGYYLLGKWADQGMWEYGVSVRTGWFTPEADAQERGKVET